MAKRKSNSAGELIFCPIASIAGSSVQPRSVIDDRELDELARSIREQGVIQPIVVVPLSAGLYEIVAGERRFRAAVRVGLTEVPAIVRDAMDESTKREIALLENLQRVDLSPLDIADALRDLAGTGLTHAAIAKRLGKTKRWVEEHLSLRRQPDTVQKLLKAGKITKNHMRVLASLPEQERVHFATMAAEKRLDSVALRRAVRRKHRQRKMASVRDMEVRFERRYGTRVEIGYQPRECTGYFKLYFTSRDELDRLTDALLP